MLCMSPTGLDRDIQRAQLELVDPQAMLREFEAGNLSSSRLGPGGPAALRERVAMLRTRLEGLQDRRRALGMVLAAMILQLLSLACARSLLALCAGNFERETGTRDIRELGGLWVRMPLTGVCCAAGALSMGAVPPFAGFWSLLMIATGAAVLGHWLIAAVAILAGMLTALAMVRMQKHVLFGPMSARVLKLAREPGAGPCIAVIGLAAACLLLGLLFVWVMPGLVSPAVEALQRGVIPAPR
jgi:formate hydrogenlyase subunit 3/multisubunit Na+/H+ antiporter MnhD subunit